MIVYAPRTDAEREVMIRWAVERVPHVYGRGVNECQSFAVLRDNAIIAVAIFSEWQPEARTIQVGGVADTPMWAKPDVIRTLLDYAFIMCGVNLLWAVTPSDLPRPQRFMEGVGARRDGILRHRFGWKRHAMVYSMTRHEWQRSRWAPAEMKEAA